MFILDVTIVMGPYFDALILYQVTNAPPLGLHVSHVTDIGEV